MNKRNVTAFAGMASAAFASSVALLVVAQHRDVAAVVPGREVRIATNVLTLPVHERNHRARSLYGPMGGIQTDAFRVFPV